MFFFNEQKIHQHLGPSSCTISSDPPSPTQSLSPFQLPTSSEMSDPTGKSKPSTCQLGPLSTVLIKVCLPFLVPLDSPIIDSAVITRTLSASSKTAAIIPILKNHVLILLTSVISVLLLIFLSFPNFLKK